MKPTPLDLAAADLEEAKEQEAAAKARRAACEEAVIALAGLKDEGAKTVKASYYKVTTTAKLIRSIDPEADIPLELLSRITKVKSELSLTMLRELEKTDPDAYAEALKAITTKPAKPSVTVQLLEQAA